ncbi:MAG: TetR/AcrR family transcriptional regulator [Pararhodobacter sp.]|nr:TetR/AcrR family transcriptional regulator [Pararhodobacter sp.]
MRYENFLALQSKGARKRERTKNAIRIATCRYLDEKPLVSLTVADICSAAGLAHGTFYLHFPDRNMLVSDLLLGFVEFIQSVLRAASRLYGSDTVRGSTEAYYELFEQNPGLMRCLVNNLEEFPEAMAAFQTLNREWVMTVATAFRRKNPNTRLSEDELLRRVYALGGMVDQYLTAILLNNDQTLRSVSGDRDMVIGTLTSLWKKGLSE